MKARGDTGQIQRAEQTLAKVLDIDQRVNNIEATLDAIIQHIQSGASKGSNSMDSKLHPQSNHVFLSLLKS